MSDEPHEEFPAQKTIRIGTAGGYVKPSTGYSFQRTQRRLQQLVENLENHIPNPKSQIPNWKGYLDSVLLNVFLAKKHPADDVFTCLFAKNKPEQILKFLDEDTTFAEDLRIMKTVPRTAFTKAAVRTAVKKFR
jgi:lycopene beta-cyclase